MQERTKWNREITKEASGSNDVYDDDNDFIVG